MTQQLDGSTWSVVLRTPRILTVALAASCGIYAMLIAVVLQPGQGDGSLDFVFLGAALSVAVVSQVLYHFFPRPPIESPTTMQAESFHTGAERRVLTDPAHARRTYVAAEFTPHILRVALSEAPAVMGVAGYLIALPMMIALALCGLSAVLVLAAFPRTQAWESAAEKRYEAVFDK